MAKNRRRKSHSPQNQPTVVHRYSAETEEKKGRRKKLKTKGIAALVAAVIALLAGWLISWLVF